MMGADDEAVEASLLAAATAQGNAEEIAEVKAMLQAVLEENARLREENRARADELAGKTFKVDPDRSRLGVMGRNAKRAGMTLAQWAMHCAENGHNPMRMDRTIVNHSRGEWAPADSEKGRAISKKRSEIARRIPRDGRGFASRENYESSSSFSGRSHAQDSFLDVEAPVPAAPRGEVKPTGSGGRKRMKGVGKHRVAPGDLLGDRFVGKLVTLYEDEKGFYILTPREPSGAKVRARVPRKRVRVKGRKP